MCVRSRYFDEASTSLSFPLLSEELYVLFERTLSTHGLQTGGRRRDTLSNPGGSRAYEGASHLRSRVRASPDPLGGQGC